MKEKIFCSVDPVVFTLAQTQLKVLLIEQKQQPYLNMMRLPGAVIDTSDTQSLEDAATRALKEKAGVTVNYFEQLKSYGSASRDPRGWSISCAYIGVINSEQISEHKNSHWISVKELKKMKLAFDHREIVDDALLRLKSKVNYSILPAHFLPEEFTMSELQGIYEDILEEKLDKSSFIRKIRESDAIEAIDGAVRSGSFRPAQLWRVKKMHNFNRNLRPKI